MAMFAVFSAAFACRLAALQANHNSPTVMIAAAIASTAALLLPEVSQFEI